MAKSIYTLLLLLTLFHYLHLSTQLQPLEANALREIQLLLNYPSVLSSFSTTWDFCNIEPTPSLTLVCYEDNVTQLHIIGNNGVSPLPHNFSIDAFFTSVVKLSHLKVLSLVSLGLWGTLPGSVGKLSSLEILNVSSNYFNGFVPVELSYLRNLQTLILDHNKFTGQVPGWLSSLHGLSVLSMENNSLFGTLPSSIAGLENLRVLKLGDNHLYGEMPDIQNLRNLQVLDIQNNYIGPHFPALNNKLVDLVLRNNSFQFGVPSELGSYYQLRKLDISLNEFVGPFLPSLFALPSVNYIDVSGNKLTGRLFRNMSCNDELAFVNLSSNLLTGDLPECLQPTFMNREVMYANNCLSNEEQRQHPSNFCHNEALAVKVLPDKLKYKRDNSKGVLASSLMGGIVGVAVIIGLGFFIIQRRNSQVAGKTYSTRLIMENVSTVNTFKLLSDARHISETMKLGATLPTYRAFTLEELKEATNNFILSSITGEGKHGQIYRGKLADGTLVAIRSLKMKKKHNAPTYTHHIEMISKLRHNNLVSALGHCFEFNLDDSSVSNIYLIFEFVPNGTLRGCISGLPGQRLNWAQRIAAAIGVAKGIQFLHTGILPGVFSNNLKITDVLVDQNLHVKISSYNLPLLAENQGMGSGVSSPGLKPNARGRANQEDKNDVHDIGVILLEILVGRPIMSQNEVMVVKDILQVSNKMDDTARRSILDPTIVKECSAESLKTVMDICLRCLSKDPADRPSVEDVLWTLQFAAQVQDSWRVDSHHILQ